MLTDLKILSQVICKEAHLFIIYHKRLVKEDKDNGRDGQGREEGGRDNGYDVTGWASVDLSHSDEDRGYGADCGGDG